MLPILIRRPLEGANGRNWPGFVIIDPDARFGAATYAQEAWEAMFKLNPVNLIQTRLSKSARRDMEIMGHECEVQAAALIYGQDAAAYRAKEAATMRRGYDGLFARMTTTGLIAAMQAKSGEARRWVERNRARLQDVK